jgi:replicative superfamily II helicase
VASHFYIRHSSIVTFNEHLSPHMSEADVLAMIAESSEFENLAVREEELPELDSLVRDACPYDVKGGGAESKQGKANVLLQVRVCVAGPGGDKGQQLGPVVTEFVQGRVAWRGAAGEAQACLGLSQSLHVHPTNMPSFILQAYISRARVDSFSLTADLMYVSQNAPRIARALFEICLRRGWSSAAELCLTMSKVCAAGGGRQPPWASPGQRRCSCCSRRC